MFALGSLLRYWLENQSTPEWRYATLPLATHHSQTVVKHSNLLKLLLNIKQVKGTFLIDKYEILIDNELTYFAKTKLLSLHPRIGIFDLNENQVLSVEKKHQDINRLNYALKRNENSIIDIHTNSLIEFTIRNHLGTLHFCEQLNNKIGIFQNDDQIGLIDKNKKVVLGGDEYILLINSDQIDPIIAIGFVIAYDCQYRNNKESVIRLDLGNKTISPEKVADENWSPKK